MARKPRYKDPHAAREAKRYDNPIPSRELILQVLNDAGKPLSAADIGKALGIRGDEAEEAFSRRLRAMIRDAQLVLNRAGRFGIAQRMDLVPGRVQGHKDGFGFVIPDDSNQEDLFLAPRQMLVVMDGDKVLVSVEGRNRFGKREGRIVEVTERATTELVGIFAREAGVSFLTPQNRRISKEVLVADMNGLTPANGDHVRTSIVQYPGEHSHVLVRLEEIIASPDEPGMEVDVALRNFEIPFQWPKEVLKQAKGLADEVLEKDKKGRVDLRDLPLVTIDGEDARDFDDAVYVAPRKRGGWRLVVAIADVSHYVMPDSPLDGEASRRATSVYFPNRVVPMLPEKLSNGLCSLNPHVDRLCLFADINVSANGRVTGFVFREGLMRSRYRLTYNRVGALIEEPDSDEALALAEELDDETLDMLWHFYSLYGALREQRDGRGAIDFETVETRILYDDQKKISAIVPVTRNVAHMMIEEAMLAANICAARLLEKEELPGLFRNHEPPKGEKLESLQTFLGPLGLSLSWQGKGAGKGKSKPKSETPTPAVFKSLTEQIVDRPDRGVIQVMMLRSLTQAKYEAENKGHFGLAYKAYAHFTSPIRRYPDLLVHRAIRYLIRKGGSELVENPGGMAKLSRKKILPYQTADMVTLGEHCSMAERRADDATRDVVKWLKCQYMEQHLGDTFEGVVTGVANFGLFVELVDLYIEGMVHVSSLDSDYYHFDEVRHVLVGESSGRQFRLGDTVSVQVAAVNTEDRKIDLLLADGGGKPRRPSRSAGARGSRGSRGSRGNAKAGKTSAGAARKAKAGSASAGSAEHSVRDALARGDIPADGKAKRAGGGKKAGASNAKGGRGKSARGGKARRR